MNTQTMIRSAATTVLVLLTTTAAAFAQGTLQQRPATIQQSPATLEQPKGTLLRPQTGSLLRPVVANCTIRTLNLLITTGNDDLRGGNDNLNVEVHYANGDMETAANVNKGANWPNHSVNNVDVPLKQPVAPSQIRELRLVHGAGGGYATPSAGQVVGASTPIVGPVLATTSTLQNIQTEDNWDMAEFQAFGLANGAVRVPIASFGFHRFTGSNPALDINAQPAGCPAGNQVVRINFTFWTADDDLRGGNDNLNITVLFADGTKQYANNVNHSQNWPNNSTKGAEILLDHPVALDQVRGFQLEDTFTGGSGGDNWNMAQMQADAVMADGSSHTIAKSGFHRFSADWSGPKAKQITIPAHPIN